MREIAEKIWLYKKNSYICAQYSFYPKFNYIMRAKQKKMISALLIFSCAMGVYHVYAASPAAAAKTYDDYKAAGTTVSAARENIRQKTQYDGQTQFVVYNVDMNSPEFKEWDFICASELSSSGLPDSYYDGYSMPLTKTVIGLRKEVIRHLAPKATKFIIDGKMVTQ